ncbi:MAG: PEP-CTERM sorting domain-containing protein [Planctomycetota bacterium]
MSAGSLTDSGDAGATFLSSSDNVSIFDSKFQVNWNGGPNGEPGYDGDGATFEDDEAFGEFVYDATIAITGIPAGESFTEIEIDTNTWNGRNSNEGQLLDDIYSVEVSDDGVNFTPITLSFAGDFPTDPNGNGFATNTGSADGFFARFVKVGIAARVEGSGSANNDNWSSEVLEVRLITAVPEPGSMALLSLGGLLVTRRRRTSRS